MDVKRWVIDRVVSVRKKYFEKLEDHVATILSSLTLAAVAVAAWWWRVELQKTYEIPLWLPLVLGVALLVAIYIAAHPHLKKRRAPPPQTQITVREPDTGLSWRIDSALLTDDSLQSGSLYDLEDYVHGPFCGQCNEDLAPDSNRVALECGRCGEWYFEYGRTGVGPALYEDQVRVFNELRRQYREGTKPVDGMEITIQRPPT